MTKKPYPFGYRPTLLHDITPAGRAYWSYWRQYGQEQQEKIYKINYAESVDNRILDTCQLRVSDS